MVLRYLVLGLYFSRNTNKQHRRQMFVRNLCNAYDFVCLQETHGTQGRSDACEPIHGITRFWSHGDRRTRGIALFVRDSFLSIFNHYSWEEIEESRVGVLRFDGQKGSLDIWVVYLSATDASARSQSIRLMGTKMRAADQTVSCISGDFNFTGEARDRFCKASGAWTGKNDVSNNNTWQTCVQLPFGMCEWMQSEHTHENGLVRSRLDRMYIN